MMVGHIKLDRKILNWEWYQDSNVFRVFLHLLLTANHKEGRWKGNVVSRGQLITGTEKLATALRLGRQEVRCCLSKLKSTNEITIKSTNKFSVITICKYDIYQSFKNDVNQQINQQNDTQSTNNQPTTNQQLTTNNNDNNNKNDNNEQEDKGVVSIFENPKLWESEKQYFFDDGKWIFKFCNDKHITVDFFDEKTKEFLSDIELKGDYKPKKELQRHFTNWYNLNCKKNGRNTTTLNGGYTKQGTSVARTEALKKW